MRKLLAMSAQPARYSGEITAEMRAVDPETRVRDLERQVTAVEEKLARAEDDLARVLQISHSFIYETDADLRMTLVNGDSREILGAAPSELIGKRLGAFLTF